MALSWFAVDIAVDSRWSYTAGIGQAGVSFAGPRVRFVFSESMKDVQLGNGGPPGRPVLPWGGETGWRAVTRVLRSCQPLMTAMEWAVADVANVFLPSDCLVCGAAMATLGRVRVCDACVSRVGAEAEHDLLCSRCGDALGMESARFAAAMGVSECTMCRLAPPEFERAVAFANYDHEMREMLHLLKFSGMRGVAEHVLGEGMAAAVRKLRGDAASELVVVPVPLFAARERERGFNQARLLAEAAVKRLRRLDPAWMLRVQDRVLVRVKDTRALYDLNPAQRRRSLQGAFRVMDGDAVRGREVLLIDDIMTTGATARECARVLKRAGAAKVWVATAAKAQPESVQNAVQHEPEGFAMWDAGSVLRKPGSESPDPGHPVRLVEPEAGKRLRF
jgi:ComF family protein